MSATNRSNVRHKDDFYATPAWCTNAILAELLERHPNLRDQHWLDPCAGTGAILEVLSDLDRQCTGVELDAGRTTTCCEKKLVCEVGDFLDSQETRIDDRVIITNPPYKLAQEFILRSLAMAPVVVMLLRLNFLGSQKRAGFHRAHPADIYVLPKRPSFTTNGGTDATEYAWFVWGLSQGGRWEVL